MKPKIFNDVLFRNKFHIFFRWTRPEIQNYLKKKFNVDKDFSNHDGFFMNIMDENLIWLAKDACLSDLAHECAHATNFVLDRAGVEPSFKNDELQAYYIGMLMNECMK